VGSARLPAALVALGRWGKTLKSKWLLFAIGWIIVLVGSLLAHVTQTANGIRVEDVRFTGSNGAEMSALLYIPANATKASPAPGILAVHGYINSRETQSGFAIEFARRGYVVLALDQTGHGYSAPPAFVNGYGGPDGLNYLHGLDFVDPANIGLEGHSMGGWTILAAAAKYPDGYKSMVLEGSSTGSGFAPEGSPQYPRNLALVYSKYDEFSALMWEVPRADLVTQSQKLWKVFATDKPVVVGQVYGSIADGTARVLYTPAVTHPGDHISTEAIGDSLDWFSRTLQGGTPLPADDQIWPRKEFGTLLALLGCVAVMLGAFEALLQQPYFTRIAHAPPVAARANRSRLWWLGLVCSAAIPVLSFYPFLTWGATWLPASWVFPQSITNQIVVWAVLNGVIAFGLAFLLRAPRAAFYTDVAPSLLIALASVATAYLALLAADFLFKVDFRFWVVALRPMSLVQFQIFLIYLLPFAVYFVLALRSLLTAVPVQGESVGAQYLYSITALAAGFLVFLLIEYLTLFASGQLFTPSQPLLTIVAIQFLPLMALIALIATFTYRRTGSYLPGAFICTLFVTWYIVAGQATQAVL
jgi:pimeloyl-ACP methyl ester carboxylesterase